ncbi:MAG: LCP family protein [Proteobacteria bacterium]|jgi:LCP family protein required for cell wall assembly|nr:LCP family protein [Pseudomonadota bacterium]
MSVDFGKRQRVARLFSVACCAALLVATRQWACSDDQGPRAGAGSPALLPGDASAEDPADAGPAAVSAVTPEPIEAGNGLEYALLLGFDGPISPPGRTDAILVLALDFDRNAIGVVSVPRDLWVDIPGFEPGRINKIYRIGENLRGRGQGHRLLKGVIARELGVPISHTVAVDMGGFEEIVDLLGGIQVDVDCPIRDNFVSKDAPSGYEPLALDAGRQLLDGRTALLYSRSRHGRSDLDRSRRQQAVLAGMWRRAARFDTLGRLPSLWEKLEGRVRTDLDLAAVLRYAALARKAGGEGIHGLVLREPTVYQWRSPDGQSALRLDRAAFRADLARLFDAPKPGKREGATCRPADVALRWRELRGKGGAAETGTDPKEPVDAGI